MVADPLAFAFFQRALLGGIVAAGLLSTLGVFMILRRLSLLGDGLGHIAFAGIAGGLYFNLDPILTAAATSLAGVVGVIQLKKLRVYADAAIAILFSLGLAVAITILSLSKGFNVDVASYLFGNILAISQSDLQSELLLAAIAVVILYAFFKEFFYVTLNEEAAQVSGIAVDRINVLMLFLMALVVVSAIKLVGILLVTSLATIPASAALQLRQSFRTTLAISAAIGILSVVAGTFISYYGNLAPSGAIVLVAIAIFAVVALAKRALTQRHRHTFG